MQILPPALTAVIEALGKLPGVGPRTAERYAYYLVKGDPGKAKKISETLDNLHAGIGFCKKTFALIPADQDLSDLYTDPKRDKKVIAVVAEPFDIVALEKTNSYSGTYHVLGGLVSPIDGVGRRVTRYRFKMVAALRNRRIVAVSLGFLVMNSVPVIF